MEMFSVILPLHFLFQRGRESSGFRSYTFYYIHQKTLYFLYSGECICLFRLLLPPTLCSKMLEEAFVHFTLVGSEYLLQCCQPPIVLIQQIFKPRSMQTEFVGKKTLKNTDSNCSIIYIFTALHHAFCEGTVRTFKVRLLKSRNISGPGL